MTEENQQDRMILVVEDSEDDYDAMIRAFHDAGLVNPFFRCRGGREVIDFMKREGVFKAAGQAANPALILLDLNMPGIDGRKVLRLLKEDPKFRAIPVVVLTTSSNRQDIAACYEAGANAYMVKPMRYGELVEAIKSLRQYWFEKVSLASEKQAPAKDKASLAYNRGWRYQVGYGVEIDFIQAYIWYRVAANDGNKDAADRLEDLTKEMTADQIEAAEQAVRVKLDEKAS